MNALIELQTVTLFQIHRKKFNYKKKSLKKNPEKILFYFVLLNRD